MSNVVMPGRAVMGWDTFPPDSHGCPWLLLMGPSPVGKAGSTYTARWKWWRKEQSSLQNHLKSLISFCKGYNIKQGFVFAVIVHILLYFYSTMHR